MRRRLWVLLDVVLALVVVGQIWSIQTCPPISGPADCKRYPAGCGWECTASVPMSSEYTCCCDARDPITGNVIGCCEATCVQWACVYPWGANCGWDVDFGALDQFGNPRVRYIAQPQPCIHYPGGLPMEGHCASGGPGGGGEGGEG